MCFIMRISILNVSLESSLVVLGHFARLKIEINMVNDIALINS